VISKDKYNHPFFFGHELDGAPLNNLRQSFVHFHPTNISPSSLIPKSEHRPARFIFAIGLSFFDARAHLAAKERLIEPIQGNQLAPELDYDVLLIAPHHGRHSDMDFSFLKTGNPKLALMGRAHSEDLAYDAYRDYPHLTNNQAGNVVAECTEAGIDIYAENADLAESARGSTSLTNKLGYPFLCHL
jgi:hypothetical protein